MRIYRCPRCRAEDITADAHPARVLNNGEEMPVFVCRGCYRATDLEYRIACETAGFAYVPLPIREGLRRLRDFYRARMAEWQDPNLLYDEDERVERMRPVREALADIERRLAIEAVPPPRLDA